MQTQEQQQNPAEITVDYVMNVVGYAAFVRSLFNRSGNPAVDFTHAVLGVCTEIHELLAARDDVNALEEMGDLEFYRHAMHQVLEDHFGEAAMKPTPELDRCLLEAYPQVASWPPQLVYPFLLCELQDMAKRWIGYGKAPTVPPIVILMAAATALRAASTLLGARAQFEDEHIRRTNVGKLLLRYRGMAFTQDSAVNRDLTAERALLDAAAKSA